MLETDEILPCWHKWRQLFSQAPEFPHNVSFIAWECAVVGCELKVPQAKLEPVGLGGEMTSGIRIVGPGGGPVILMEGGLAKELVRTEAGKMETHHFTHLE